MITLPSEFGELLSWIEAAAARACCDDPTLSEEVATGVVEKLLDLHIEDRLPENVSYYGYCREMLAHELADLLRRCERELVGDLDWLEHPAQEEEEAPKAGHELRCRACRLEWARRNRNRLQLNERQSSMVDWPDWEQRPAWLSDMSAEAYRKFRRRLEKRLVTEWLRLEADG